MALLECSGCRQAVSDRASECPRCGLPVAGARPAPSHNIDTGAVAPAFERLPQSLMIAIIVCLVTVNAGIMVFYWSRASEGGQTGGVAETQKNVTASDGRCALTLTSGWVESPQLVPEAIYCAQHSGQHLVIVVFAEEKLSLRDALAGGEIDLDKYSQLLRDLLRRELSSASEEPAARITIGGCRAIQAVVRGVTPDGGQLAFLHTVVDTPNTFYQVRVFTTADRFASQRGEFQRIAASFRTLR